MGIIDGIKDAFGVGDASSSADEFEDEFEIEEGMEEFDDELEGEPEEELGPWDSAYRFSEEMLEEDGFVDMQEFTRKAMFFRVSKHPRFRDRFQSGIDAMDRLSSSVEGLQSLRGGSSDKNYGEMADKIQNANKLINEVNRMSGQEEAMVSEFVGLARDAVDAMGSRRAGGQGIDTSMEISEE